MKHKRNWNLNVLYSTSYVLYTWTVDYLYKCIAQYIYYRHAVVEKKYKSNILLNLKNPWDITSRPKNV